MYGFNYNFNTQIYIIDNLKLIKDFDFIKYLILGGIFFIIILLIYYIFPLIIIFFDTYRKEDKINKRKKLLKTIAIQKDLDDEIEKELKLK